MYVSWVWLLRRRPHHAVIVFFTIALDGPDWAPLGVEQYSVGLRTAMYVWPMVCLYVGDGGSNRLIARKRVCAWRGNKCYCGRNSEPRLLSCCRAGLPCLSERANRSRVESCFGPSRLSCIQPA